jgi:adenylosuccinate lyase
MFLAIDCMLDSGNNLIEHLIINEKQIKKNLDKYGPFAASESIMMAVVKNGGNRQEMHEILREHAMKAYELMQETDKNPLEEYLLNDKKILQYIDKQTIKKLLDASSHIGIAKTMCKQFVKRLHDEK